MTRSSKVPSASTAPPARKRAPSERALATKARILDAAETVFARKGFDGSTIRDIAASSGEPISLIHHHGGGKEALFRQVIARRAADLAHLRLAALSAAKQDQTPTLEGILDAFFEPFLTLANKDEQWRSYARLVAHVSADERWRDLTELHFDPTAKAFIAEICAAAPEQRHDTIAAGFVFSVSAMLSVLSARWRIHALGKGREGDGGELTRLTTFCAAGIRNMR
ncbi:MAG: TetR/AcrR family transcriptional regulator [Pikeienuella sp.]